MSICAACCATVVYELQRAHDTGALIDRQLPELSLAPYCRCAPTTMALCWSRCSRGSSWQSSGCVWWVGAGCLLANIAVAIHTWYAVVHRWEHLAYLMASCTVRRAGHHGQHLRLAQRRHHPRPHQPGGQVSCGAGQRGMASSIPMAASALCRAMSACAAKVEPHMHVLQQVWLLLEPARRCTQLRAGAPSCPTSSCGAPRRSR